MKGAGYSTSEKRYEYADSSASRSTLYYYRLKQTDHDQKTSFSDIISSDLSSTRKQLTIFPNPSSDIMTVSGASGKDYSVINSSGEIVIKGKFAEDAELNVSGLTPGLYTLSVNGFFRKIAVCR